MEATTYTVRYSVMASVGRMTVEMDVVALSERTARTIFKSRIRKSISDPRIISVHKKES